MSVRNPEETTHYRRREGKEIEGFEEPWLNEVKKLMNQSEMWQVSRDVCIYRVPKCIRINKAEDYDPFEISFGPYHKKKDPYLSRMDQYKIEAVQRMLKRNRIDVNKLIERVGSLEDKIRRCYAEPIEWSKVALPWIFTMDGCFILECFRGLDKKRSQSDVDSFSLIFQHRDINNTVSAITSTDMIKLENQIPMCILIELFMIDFPPPEDATLELARLLNNVGLFRGDPFLSSLSFIATGQKLKEHLSKQPRHLLELYRMVVIDMLSDSTQSVSGEDMLFPSTSSGSGESMPPHAAPPVTDTPPHATLPVTYMPRYSTSSSGAENFGEKNGVLFKLWNKLVLFKSIFLESPNLSPQPLEDSRSTPCASLLQVAGIKFQPGKLRFEKKWYESSSRTLYLPPIIVNEYTEIGLQNLTAYEECQRCSAAPEQTVISQYVFLFDDLIDSEKDVAILKEARVIVSVAVSDNHVAEMFNNIQRGITFDPINEIEAVMTDVRKHYRSQWKVWLSQFKIEYFSKPWYVVPLIMGVLILGSTVAQTFSSYKY